MLSRVPWGCPVRWAGSGRSPWHAWACSRGRCVPGARTFPVDEEVGVRAVPSLGPPRALVHPSCLCLTPVPGESTPHRPWRRVSARSPVGGQLFPRGALPSARRRPVGLARALVLLLWWAGPVLACSSSLPWAHHGDPGLVPGGCICRAPGQGVCPVPGGEGRAPAGPLGAASWARHACGRKQDQPPPHGHGAWRHLPAITCPPPAGGEGTRTVVGAVTQGQCTGQGGGGVLRGRRWPAGSVGSGWDLRVVRAQGHLLAKAAGWSSLRLGFCPPTPVLVTPGHSSGLGPLPGAGLCQAPAGRLLSRQVEPPLSAGLFGAWAWPLEAWPVPGLESSAVLSAAHRHRGEGTGQHRPSGTQCVCD